MKAWTFAVAGSQIRTVWSLPTQASNWRPSTVTGHTDLTASRWPCRVRVSSPAARSQIRMVRLLLLATINRHWAHCKNPAGLPVLPPAGA